MAVNYLPRHILTYSRLTAVEKLCCIEEKDAWVSGYSGP